MTTIPSRASRCARTPLKAPVSRTAAGRSNRGENRTVRRAVESTPSRVRWYRPRVRHGTDRVTRENADVGRRRSSRRVRRVRPARSRSRTSDDSPARSRVRWAPSGGGSALEGAPRSVHARGRCKSEGESEIGDSPVSVRQLRADRVSTRRPRGFPNGTTASGTVAAPTVDASSGSSATTEPVGDAAALEQSPNRRLVPDGGTSRAGGDFDDGINRISRYETCLPIGGGPVTTESIRPA